MSVCCFFVVVSFIVVIVVVVVLSMSCVFVVIHFCSISNGMSFSLSLVPWNCNIRYYLGWGFVAKICQLNINYACAHGRRGPMRI